MTVTQNEINELLEARKSNTLDALVTKWQRELRVKELGKKDSVELTLTNMKDNATKTIVGKRIAEHYAFHKDAWGGSFYHLTHIASGIMILSGKRAEAAEAVEMFTNWPNLARLNTALEEHGIKALTVLPQELRDEYRTFYDKANGR